jgi:glucan phosphoethanolaminetransferase (alkaline phosphatase superfamily)
MAPAIMGCRQACELEAFAVGYLYGLFFGSMGVAPVALLIAALARKIRPFWSMFFTLLALGLLGLVVGFFVAFLFDCEHIYVYGGLPWGLALALMPIAFKVTRRRAPTPISPPEPTERTRP